MAEKKGFIWKGLRIGFWIMVIAFVLSMATEIILFFLIFFLSAAFVFIVSIMHLNYHKVKTTALVALISSVVLSVITSNVILNHLAGAFA